MISGAFLLTQTVPIVRFTEGFLRGFRGAEDANPKIDSCVDDDRFRVVRCKGRGAP